MLKIRVWDLPTRVGHWALAVLVVVAILTSEEEGVLFVVHASCGIAAGAIVLFRLVWGVVGNERARFADFVHGWTRTRAYALALLKLKPPRFIGHNPLGGWMIVALLGVTLLCAVTGTVAAGLLGPGAAEAAGEVHEALGSLIQIMILVHIAGVLIDWLLTRDNLIAAMFSGEKAVEPAVADESAATAMPRDARGGSAWLALVVIVPLIALAGWAWVAVDPPSVRLERSYDRDD